MPRDPAAPAKARPGFPLAKLGVHAMRGAALAAVATIVVVVLASSDETWEQLRRFERWTLLAAAGMVVLAWLCNGARTWTVAHALGHPLRYRQAIAITLSTEFGVAASPGGVGGTVIRIAFLKRAGVPLTTGFSMLAADVAADVAFFVALVPIAAVFFLTNHFWRHFVEDFRPGMALVPVFVALVVGLALYLVIRGGAWKPLGAALARATPWGRRRRLPARFRLLRLRMAKSVRDVGGVALFLLRHRRRALLANFALAAVQWTCRYGVLPILLLGFGTTVNPLPLVFIQGCLFFISLMVVLPGGGGGVEILSALLLPWFVPKAQVPVVLLLWRFFTYHCYLVGGGTVFFLASRERDPVFQLGGGPRRRGEDENHGGTADTGNEAR